jgi:hypothetical protein
MDMDSVIIMPSDGNVYYESKIDIIIGLLGY